MGGPFSLSPGLGAGVAIPGFTGGENGLQTEVVPLGDRVVLVVMAIGAPDGQTQGHLAEGAHLIGSPHVLQHLGIGVQRIGPFPQRPDRHGVLHGFGLFRPEFVAADLFHEETVVGLVFVQAADDIVAVAPRLFIEDVRLVAARIRVAHHIQPMTRPALAMSGG